MGLTAVERRVLVAAWRELRKWLSLPDTRHQRRRADPRADARAWQAAYLDRTVKTDPLAMAGGSDAHRQRLRRALIALEVKGLLERLSSGQRTNYIRLTDAGVLLAVELTGEDIPVTPCTYAGRRRPGPLDHLRRKTNRAADPGRSPTGSGRAATGKDPPPG